MTIIEAERGELAGSFGASASDEKRPANRQVTALSECLQIFGKFSTTSAQDPRISFIAADARHPHSPLGPRDVNYANISPGRAPGATVNI